MEEGKKKESQMLPIAMFTREGLAESKETIANLIAVTVSNDLKDRYNKSLEENNLTGKETKAVIWYGKDDDKDFWLIQVSFEDKPEDLFMKVSKEKMLRGYTPQPNNKESGGGTDA